MNATKSHLKPYTAKWSMATRCLRLGKQRLAATETGAFIKDWGLAKENAVWKD